VLAGHLGAGGGRVGDRRRRAVRASWSRGGLALEDLASVRAVGVDKTGTLTLGLLQLETVVAIDSLDDGEAPSLDGRGQARSEHPLAAALRRAARERQLPVPPPRDSRRCPGAARRRAWTDGHCGREARGSWPSGPVRCRRAQAGADDRSDRAAGRAEAYQADADADDELRRRLLRQAFRVKSSHAARSRRLTVWLASDVDPTLVAQTLAVERSGCPFLAVGFDPTTRRLKIGVDGPQPPALTRSRLRYPESSAGGSLRRSRHRCAVRLLGRRRPCGCAEG
jgi:hypothetical protein